MKQIYLLLLIGVTTLAQAQADAFITTWEVTNGSLNITVPVAVNSSNNYTINFGDGTTLINQTGNTSHTYAAAGTYTVTITGVFKAIRFAASATPAKIKTIEQWGTNQWQTMFRSFYGCSNLIINATDSPNLSQVTDMTETFRGATSLNQSLNNWDVSNVTLMKGTFYGASSFNQPLNNWNVSNVTTMQDMFRQATVFNQPLNSWNVGNVVDMSYMFCCGLFI